MHQGPIDKIRRLTQRLSQKIPRSLIRLSSGNRTWFPFFKSPKPNSLKKEDDKPTPVVNETELRGVGAQVRAKQTSPVIGTARRRSSTKRSRRTTLFMKKDDVSGQSNHLAYQLKRFSRRMKISKSPEEMIELHKKYIEEYSSKHSITVRTPMTVEQIKKVIPRLNQMIDLAEANPELKPVVQAFIDNYPQGKNYIITPLVATNLENAQRMQAIGQYFPSEYIKDILQKAFEQPLRQKVIQQNQFGHLFDKFPEIKGEFMVGLEGNQQLLEAASLFECKKIIDSVYLEPVRQQAETAAWEKIAREYAKEHPEKVASMDWSDQSQRQELAKEIMNEPKYAQMYQDVVAEQKQKLSHLKQEIDSKMAAIRSDLGVNKNEAQRMSELFNVTVESVGKRMDQNAENFNSNESRAVAQLSNKNIQDIMQRMANQQQLMTTDTRKPPQVANTQSEIPEPPKRGQEVRQPKKEGLLTYSSLTQQRAQLPKATPDSMTQFLRDTFEWGNDVNMTVENGEIHLKFDSVEQAQKAKQMIRDAHQQAGLESPELNGVKTLNLTVSQMEHLQKVTQEQSSSRQQRIRQS